MISNRSYLAMTVMMLILFFLFMMTQIVSQDKSTYSQNSHYSEEVNNITEDDSDEIFEKNIEYTDEYTSQYATVNTKINIVFVGDSSSEAALLTESFCKYNKGNIYFCNTLDQLFEMDLSFASLILVSPDEMDEKRINSLEKLVEKGSSIVFYELPDESVIEKEKSYQEFFGIQKIKEKEKELTGVKLFSGFILGGELVYQEKGNEDKQMQDLDITIPWYQVDYGCKTYMTGLIDENEQENEEIENEELPAVIWRTNHGDGFVYAINGDYFKGTVAMGILNGIISQENLCYLYPVVNAQNISIIDFPIMSDENSEELETIYSRQARQLSTNILLPSLISFLQRCEKKASVYMIPQADYTDSNLPKTTDIDLYLEQFYQNNIEIGKSMKIYGTTDLQNKFETDGIFYENFLSDYKISAIYAKDSESILLNIDKSDLEGIRTIVTDKASNDSGQIIKALSGNITEQKIITDASDYSFYSDLEMRSVESVLGYSNVLFDLGKVYFPESDNDHWEILSEEIFSVSNTYWKAYEAFEQTTISESDRRIRNFLNTNFSYKVNENDILVNISHDDNIGNNTENNTEDSTASNTETMDNTKTIDNIETIDSWFILRTHNQKISNISEGEYYEIEDGAYLIHAINSQFTISLINSDSIGILIY